MDGKYEVYFARIDNADFNDAIDFTKVMHVYDENMVTKYNKRVILENGDRRMTKEEARATLEKSDEVRAHIGSDGKTVYAVKLGKFYTEYIDAFAWVGYPYMVDPPKPPSPDFWFQYFVDKEDYRVSYPFTPMKEEEAHAYWIEGEPSRAE
ncbi:MAG: hypothetical protein LBH75_04150 [Treponema sp.]|jgi:hypothetical protein|nr:hypothetical protein [Treponema sp.]